MSLFGTSGKKKLTIEIDEKVYNAFSQCVDDMSSLDDTIERAMRNYITEKNKIKEPDSIVQSEPITEKNRYYGNFPTTKSDQFMQYLEEIAISNNGKHYSPNTAKGYKSAIKTIGKMIERDLWQITSPEDIRDIIEQLTYNSYYNQKNGSSDNTLSSGLARYGEFLTYLCSGDSFDCSNVSNPEKDSLEGLLQKWLRKKTAPYNVMKTYFALSSDGKTVTKDRMQRYAFNELHENNFQPIFCNMKNGGNHVSAYRIFDLKYNHSWGDIVVLTDDVKETVEKYRQEFLK